MEKPALYRKQPLNQARNRTTTPLSTDEKSQVSSTLTTFFELFKAKHL